MIRWEETLSGRSGAYTRNLPPTAPAGVHRFGDFTQFCVGRAPPQLGLGTLGISLSAVSGSKNAEVLFIGNCFQYGDVYPGRDIRGSCWVQLSSREVALF